MHDFHVLNVLGHISAIESAEKKLISDGFDIDIANQAGKKLLQIAFESNKNLLINSDESDGNRWFHLSDYYISSDKAIEIGINQNRHYSVCILAESESDRKIAEALVQSLICFQLDDDNSRYDYFCCASAKRGGVPFGNLNRIIAANPENFGSGVLTTDSEFSRSMETISERLGSNVSESNGVDIFEYNITASKKLPITKMFVFDSSGNSSLVTNKIKSFCERGAEGINTVIVDSDRAYIEQFKCDYYIEILDGKFVYKCGQNNVSMIPAQFEINNKILSKYESSTGYDADFNTILPSETRPFERYSLNGIQVPIGVDKYGVCEFKIGGEHAAHALMSGSTGSGKSVSLHTIIDMITYLYSPDDVQIWAIDYKAVEFGCYAFKKTPHIKVIGQDNSQDFSISLLNLIYYEYERRKLLFKETMVNSIEEYRRQSGNYALPRILIVIDEFHNLVQAIMNHPDSTYKNKLENLLKETRAMGISFLFCSQTVSTGLTGLTESGRNQITSRICLKQISADEVRETLKIDFSQSSYFKEAKEFERGYGFYKDGAFGSEKINKIKFVKIPSETREMMIDKVNEICADKYDSDDDIICKDSNRYLISERRNHYFNKIITGKAAPDVNDEELDIYPAGPTTLDSEFKIKLSRDAGNNILIAGADNDMRESIVYFSVISCLLNRNVSVVFNILDENNSKSKSLINLLKTLDSYRLSLNIGLSEVLDHIGKYSKVKNTGGNIVVNFWYNTNKIKDEMMMADDSDEEYSEPLASEMDMSDPFAALDLAIDKYINNDSKKSPENYNEEKMNFDKVSGILKNMFELGPGRGIHNIVIYNTPKNIRYDSFLKLSYFDYRIGTKMSIDDSYTVFGTETFIKGADENTCVCFNGGKKPVHIRPYLRPENDWVTNIYKKIKEI